MRVAPKQDSGLFFFIAVMALLCYAAIAYSIPRTNFKMLILLSSVLFILYMLMTAKDFSEAHFNKLLWLALLSRGVFLFAIPTLSDDYFRFIWEGVLTSNGINPYLYTPGMVNQLHGTPLPAFVQELKLNMNSVIYFSPYPPGLQLIFFIGVKLGGYHLSANIFLIRIVALLAETGTVFTAIKMLGHFKLPRNRVLLYALNPLVIMELSGNLHAEVCMIFFLLLSFYFLAGRRYFLSSVIFGLAVSTKLLPLIFIPAIISLIGVRKGAAYTLITLLTVAVCFLPFVNAVFLQNILESVGYYFQKFEFNASIYYILRWIGYDITGFNLIYFFGKVLPLCAFIFILRIAFYKKIATTAIFFERLLFTLLAYYLFSLIVHPWYITVLVALSVFSVYRFALAWSALVMLTYSTYLQIPYHEILWVTALEYILLGVVVYAEIYHRKNLCVPGG